MITLKINGEIIGEFPSVYACWKPLDQFYNSLPEQYETCVDWCLVNDDLSYMDGRGWLDAPNFDGSSKGGYQHPQGMPGGIWFACCEDARRFNNFLKYSGWVPAQFKDFGFLIGKADSVREFQEGVDFEGVSYD